MECSVHFLLGAFFFVCVFLGASVFCGVDDVIGDTSEEETSSSKQEKPNISIVFNIKNIGLLNISQTRIQQLGRKICGSIQNKTKGTVDFSTLAQRNDILFDFILALLVCVAEQKDSQLYSGKEQYIFSIVKPPQLPA